MFSNGIFVFLLIKLNVWYIVRETSVFDYVDMWPFKLFFYNKSVFPPKKLIVKEITDSIFIVEYYVEIYNLLTYV